MTNQEKLATEIMESHYQAIIKGLIGAYPLKMAKQLGCIEYLRAKHCALVSVNKILELPIGKVKIQKQWLEIRNKIERF